MTEEQEERLVSAYEGIGKALAGLHEEAKRAGEKLWPDQKPQRETIVTRVETDDERELKLQGVRRRTVAEVIDPNAEEDEDEYVGARTKQWLKDHPQENKAPSPSGEELL